MTEFKPDDREEEDELARAIRSVMNQMFITTKLVDAELAFPLWREVDGETPPDGWIWQEDIMCYVSPKVGRIGGRA